MRERILSDAQWCVLDLLMRARQKGVDRLNRMEVLESSLPTAAAMKLTWAALSMPVGLVTWIGKHDFAITEEGISVYELRFGSKAVPSKAADVVICLPGPDHTQH
jgi:hypothetical protein